MLAYLEHLRRERNNGSSAVNRTATILKSFYRAMVAMGHLHYSANPMNQFPRLKPPSRKLPVVLSSDEVEKLIASPPGNTVLGIRDRAILTLLCGTGIRASECAGLREEDVDLDDSLVKVRGKGGHERSVPLNIKVRPSLRNYRLSRGLLNPREPFFQSRHPK